MQDTISTLRRRLKQKEFQNNTLSVQLQQTKKALRIKCDENDTLVLEVAPARNKLRMLELRLRAKGDQYKE